MSELTDTDRATLALLAGLAAYIERQPRSDDPVTTIVNAIRAQRRDLEAILRDMP